jgi:transposase-like protein
LPEHAGGKAASRRVVDIERANKEIKRCTDVLLVFPND